MSTISSLTAANTIDATADYLAIDTASLNTTQKINRNTLLGLSSAPVGLTDSQTLTNKILTTPTINGATLSGTLSGTYTIGGTPTFPASVVTLTGSQTLTNKVLTSPTINAPTITNATINADALTGFTTSNSGTVYGISVTTGQISSALTLTNGLTVSSGIVTLPGNSLQAAAFATNAITLGYAQITTNFTTTSGTVVQVTGLTSAVTIPAGSRRVRITAYVPRGGNDTTNKLVTMSIWDGTVGSGTQLTSTDFWMFLGAAYGAVMASAVVTPAAGSKTYNVGFLRTDAGTGTIVATATSPAYILVEAI